MLNLFKNKKKKPETIKDVLDYLAELEENYGNISRSLEELKKESKKNLAKIGLIRFNPFKEIGGDQSFSLAILDADNNGFVVTSYYQREASRVYAKPVENGVSKHQLSNEEKEAINKAING